MEYSGGMKVSGGGVEYSGGMEVSSVERPIAQSPDRPLTLSPARPPPLPLPRPRIGCILIVVDEVRGLMDGPCDIDASSSCVAMR